MGCISSSIDKDSINSSNLEIYRSKKDGVSIITACKNRNKNLLISIDSWIKCIGVKEIVIVDWGSDIPVHETLQDILPISEVKIIIVSITNVRDWILTTAYNTAASYATYGKILKLDCDNIINKLFIDRHNLDQHGLTDRRIFFSGNWKNSRNPNENHLNGVVFLNKADFDEVNGYNEHIITYGWDDSDLYSRLEDNLEHRYIDNDYIMHIEHSNKERGIIDHNREEKSESFKLIQTNRLLCTREEAKWSKKKSKSTPILSRVKPFCETYKKIGHELYIGSIALIKQLDESVIEFANAEYKRYYVHVKPVVPIHKKNEENILYIKVENGLGNRLRALASAYNLYKGLSKDYSMNNKWKFVLIWIPNVEHCNCEFSTLFLPEKDITVVNHVPLIGEAIKIYPNKHTHSSFEERELNISDIESLLKVLPSIQHPISVVIESSSIITSPYYNWGDDCIFLRRLNLTPEVECKVGSILVECNRKKIDLNNCIGVCIREGQDTKCDDISNWNISHKESWEKWRNCSQTSRFIEHMNKFKDDHFFVTGDNINVFVQLKKEKSLEGRITFLNREIWDRSSEQLIFALADVILLAKTKLLFGSNWSSFSELVRRFSSSKMQLAGVDF
jgi:hypothetical protein